MSTLLRSLAQLSGEPGMPLLVPLGVVQAELADACRAESADAQERIGGTRLARARKSDRVIGRCGHGAQSAASRRWVR